MANEVEILVTSKDKTKAGFDSAYATTDRGVSKIGDRIKSFGKVAAAGFAAAGIAAVAFGKEAVSEASDLNETINKTKVIFGDNAKNILKWSQQSATAFGLSRNQALGYASDLGNMLDQLGFADRATQNISKSTVKFAADLGSFHNLETGDVLDRISAAMRGEFDSLQALIPNINAARVEQVALAQTGKKNADALTAQEKAAATLAIIHKDGAKAAGDFAKTSGSLANQQKIAAAQFDNLQAKVGKLLLPVMVKLMGFITGTVLPGLMRFSAWFQQDAIPAIQDFAKSTRERLRPVIEWIVQHWPEIQETIGRVFRRVVGDVRAFIDLVRKIWNKWGDDIMRVVKVVWQYAYNTIKNNLKIIKGVIDVITGIIKGDWGRVWKGIREILDGVWSQIKNIVQTALRIVREIIRSGWDAVKDLTKRAWDWLKDQVSEAWDRLRERTADGVSRIVELVKSIPGKLANLPGRFVSIGRQMIGKLKDGVVDVMSGIGGWVKSKIVDPIVDAVKHFFGMSSPSKVMRGLGKHVVDGLLEGMSPGNWLDIAKNIFGGLPEAVGQFLKKGLVNISDIPTDLLEKINIPGFDNAPFADIAAGQMSNQALGKKLLEAIGWGQYWSQFNALVMSESGWSNTAQNPTSSAYGIGQFLDSTWATVGGHKTSDPALQIQYMLRYIAQRYGNPAQAWAFKQSHNWYGDGLEGGIFTKPTLIGVGEKGPERVDVTPLHRKSGSGHGMVGASAGSQTLVSLLVAVGDHVSSRVKDAWKKIGKNLIRSLSDGVLDSTEQSNLKSRLETLATNAAEAVKAALDAKRQIVQTYASGFASSIFGATYTGTRFGEREGEQITSVGDLLDFAQERANKALRVKRATRTLVGKGLSKNLIRQLASSGEAGQAQLFALAGASRSTIREFNRLNAQANASLRGAGGILGQDLYGERIRDAKRREHQIDRLVNSMERVLDRTKGKDEIHLRIEAGDSDASKMLAHILRKYIRVHGGNVQTVLGR